MKNERTRNWAISTRGIFPEIIFRRFPDGRVRSRLLRSLHVAGRAIPAQNRMKAVLGFGLGRLIFWAEEIRPLAFHGKHDVVSPAPNRPLAFTGLGR